MTLAQVRSETEKRVGWGGAGEGAGAGLRAGQSMLKKDELIRVGF